MRLPPTVLILILATADGLSAQTPQLRGRMAGPVAERFFDQDSRFLVLGYGWCDLRPSGFGFDGVLGLVPAALPAGALLVQADASMARAVRTGPATLVIGAGVSNFVALEQSFEFHPGVRTGVALLIPLEARLVGRVDLARHLYLDGDETYRYWSIGLSLPAISVR